MGKKSLYEINRKPVRRIRVSDAIVIDDDIWFMVDSFNCLMRMNIETKKMDVVGSFLGEPYAQRYLYSVMERVGNKIYFAPYYAKSIAVYDIKEERFSTIELNTVILGCEPECGWFSGMQKYGEDLFLFPAHAKAIIRLNTTNDTMEYITEWTEDVSVNENKAYFWMQKLQKDNRLYIPFYGMNAILSMDCITKQYKIYKPSIHETGYSGICADGDKLWLYGALSGQLYSWKPEDNTVEETTVFSEGKMNDWDELKWLVCNDNKVEVYNVFDNRRKRDESSETIVVKQGGYMFVREDEDYILYCTRDTSVLTVVNKKRNKTYMIEMVTSEKIADLKKMRREIGLIAEMEEVVLYDFLQEVI